MDITGETASSKLGVGFGMKLGSTRANKRVGAPREIRTPDQLVRSQLLYPAELWARGSKYSQDLSTGHRPFALFTSVGFKTTNTLSMMLASMIYSHPKPLQNRIQ